MRMAQEEKDRLQLSSTVGGNGPASQHPRRAVSLSGIAGIRGGVKVNRGPLFPPIARESHCQW